MIFEHRYMLMIEKADGEINFAKTDKPDGRKLVIAKEEDKHLLETIGDRLLKANVIIGYQLIRTESPPIRNYEPVKEGYSKPFAV